MYKPVRERNITEKGIDFTKNKLQPKKAMLFKVGEGLTEEQRKKAEETVRKPDSAMQEAQAKSFWGKTKSIFTTREEAVPVRRAFEVEPILTKAPPIITTSAQLGFSLLEAIPRAMATVGGELKAEFQPQEVESNINLKRFGFEGKNYKTASLQMKEALDGGENPWIAGLRIVSEKTLDIAFGASLLKDLLKLSTSILLRGGSEAKIEAQQIVDAYKTNSKEVFQRLKKSPLAEREKVMADLVGQKNLAEKTLKELGKPTELDKLRVSTARYTDLLARETPLGKGFAERFAKPDLGLKTPTLPKLPYEPLQLAGQREVQGQSPAMGLSIRKVEDVGKGITTEQRLIKEARKYKSAREFVKALEKEPLNAGVDRKNLTGAYKIPNSNQYVLAKKTGKMVDETIDIVDESSKKISSRINKTPEIEYRIANFDEANDPNLYNSFLRAKKGTTNLGDIKSQLTDIWNKAQAETKPQKVLTEQGKTLIKDEQIIYPKQQEIKPSILPAVIQGDTFSMGAHQTTEPTLKSIRGELKATQKEIKNAQIAQEKANKLELKEQKIREEAITNLQRFRGNTENIKADLEKRNLSQEDIDNIILEDGTKLNDAIKVKRNSDGSLSDVITKKEIDDLKASYTDEIPKNKWQKRNVLVDGKEVATSAMQSLELPYAYFERKGLSSIYDQVTKSGRDAEVLKNSFIQKFKDADLFKDGSWFTADRFNIGEKESKAVSEYYLGRQGKTKPVELSSLPEKSQKFIKVFDEIINETTQPFYQMASKMGKEPGVVENYAPLMTAQDIKLIDQGGSQDWLFRKHPAFSALKERVKKAPVEVYEKDYRKVAIRWLEGMSQFLEMSPTTNHLKYLIGSDEFQNIVKDSDYAIISRWLKDITTPKTPDTLIKKTFTPLSQLTRKGVAMGALGLNYATILKQALTQIPITIVEKSLPKASSEYAKAFGIKTRDLPSISKRKGDIAIQDLQGKISRIFTGGITQFDKMNAQAAINGLLDKEYSKYLKEGVPVTKEIQALIEKTAQDKIDMWFGGFFKGQRPEAYREEIGNFILMFTYPLTSQTNGFFRHMLKAKGFKGNTKAVAEVLASVVGIAYMEQVIENLSPKWSDEKQMTEDILLSLSGNLPIAGNIAYSIVNEKDINLSPVIGNINNIVRAISKGDGEKIMWTIAETAGLPKQTRRIKEGFQIMEDGGITDNNGKMLAPVEGTMEYMRAFLRGKYGPIASQDYIRNVGEKKEDKRWFVPEVEFIQNGDYERKAEIYKTFDKEKKKEFYNMLSEGQQKKLDNALKGITPKSQGKKSLSDIFK